MVWKHEPKQVELLSLQENKQQCLEKNLVAIFLSIFLSTPLVERGIEMNHYWKLAQLQNKIPQHQRETLYTHKKIFFEHSPLRILFCPMCVLGFLLYNWYDNIDFYSMSKRSCRLLLHLFPWEKQRDDSTSPCFVELLGLNHHG